MRPLVLATVLKLGGEYREEHVEALARSYRKHNTKDVPVFCLTDSKKPMKGVISVPLLHDWQGWWSKIELFRPNVFPDNATVLYMDLDTVVVNVIPSIEAVNFTMLRCAYRPEQVGSGVMAWRAESSWVYESIYNEFKKNPIGYMNEYRRQPNKWGDQGFIANVLESLGEQIDRFDTRVFRSYKVHCSNGIPSGACVVYFHGRPKPWNVQGWYS